MKSYRIITYLTAGLMTGHAPAGEKQIYIESVHKQTNVVKTFDMSTFWLRKKKRFVNVNLSLVIYYYFNLLLRIF